MIPKESLHDEIESAKQHAEEWPESWNNSTGHTCHILRAT